MELRKRAVLLYMEGLGFSSIEGLWGVSHMSVMRGVKGLAAQIRSIKAADTERHHATFMELDEMWHYVGKKTANSGCG